MGIEALFSRRIGVQPRNWTPLAEPRFPTASGVDIEDPGPRAAVTLKRARDPGFLEPSFTGLPRGSSWCASEQDLALRIHQAEAWLGFLAERGDHPLLAVEHDLAQKLTPQRGAASGWDVFHDGLGLSGGGSIDEAAELLGRWLIDRFPATTPQWTKVPRGTNSGAPTYGTSDPDKLFHALLARQITDWESAENIYAQYKGMFEAVGPIHALTFSRTGPTKKALPMYDWVGDKFAQTAEGLSVAPRRRAVFGVPAFINMALLGHANTVKYGVMRTPWTSHPDERSVLEGLEYDRARAGRGCLTFSDDISGFDQSVRRSHQESIARHIYSRYWPPDAINLWLEAQRMPVLGPPLTAGARAWMYTRPHGGVTTSGIITTTLDGTLINLARAITTVAMANRWSVAASFAALIAGAWGIKVWGDDTVMTVQRGFSLERYTEANLTLGYSTAPVRGATFLMKHYDLTYRRVFPLATRILQQTFWNEKGGRTEEIELLGLFVRTTGFHLNPLGRDCWALLTERAPLLDRWHVTTREQLASLMEDPGFRSRLDAGIRANLNIVAEWLSRAERGHTEDEALIRWLSALLGRHPSDRAELDIGNAMALTIQEATQKAHQLGGYLARRVDDRGAPPHWLDAALETNSIESDDEDNSPKGD